MPYSNSPHPHPPQFSKTAILTSFSAFSRHIELTANTYNQMFRRHFIDPSSDYWWPATNTPSVTNKNVKSSLTRTKLLKRTMAAMVTRGQWVYSDILRSKVVPDWKKKWNYNFIWLYSINRRRYSPFNSSGALSSPCSPMVHRFEITLATNTEGWQWYS